MFHCSIVPFSPLFIDTPTGSSQGGPSFYSSMTISLIARATELRNTGGAESVIARNAHVRSVSDYPFSDEYERTVNIFSDFTDPILSSIQSIYWPSSPLIYPYISYLLIILFFRPILLFYINVTLFWEHETVGIFIYSTLWFVLELTVRHWKMYLLET